MNVRNDDDYDEDQDEEGISLKHFWKLTNMHEMECVKAGWNPRFSQVPCPPLVLGSAQAGFWRRILDDKASFWQVFSWGGCCNAAQIVIHELFGGSNTKGGEVDWGFVTFCLNWKSARILSLLEPEHLMIEAVTCNHWAILKLESVFSVLSVEVTEWTFMAISVASGSSSWSRTLFLREARLVFGL